MRRYGIGLLLIAALICIGANAKDNKSNSSPFTAYLMAYSSSDGNLHYAYSHNARHWTELNDGLPILTASSPMSTPFLNRVKDGFQMVAASKKAVMDIYHWQSKDLLDWTGKSITLIDESQKQVLSPEFYYSQDENLFYLYWTSQPDGKNTPFYLTTRDWSDIDPSKAAVYFDPGQSALDLTIVQYNNLFYGFFKKGIIGDWLDYTVTTSTSLNPEVDGFKLITAYPEKHLVLPTPTKPTRSPQVIKVIGEDLWYVYANPNEGELDCWQTRDFKTYARVIVDTPEGANLGSIIPITEAELTLLQKTPQQMTMAVSGKILRLEDMDLGNMVQGWGKPGIKKTIIDLPLTINGKVFKDGVGTHAVSRFTIDLKGSALAFKAQAGVDDEQADGREGKGSVSFNVYVDRNKAASSGVMKIGDGPYPFNVDLKDAQRLDLIVLDGGDGIGYDHADWADAYLVLDPTSKKQPVSVPRPTPRPKEILTPPVAAAPRINAPKVIGAGEKREFTYYIPVTGKRPMNLRVEGLSEGIDLDTKTGMLVGQTGEAGQWPLVIYARNSAGTDSKEILLTVGDDLAKTPPLGWNSWNCWGKFVKQEDIESAADAFVDTGLINHGWTYVVIDDAWAGVRDPETNKLGTNEKFPDMKALGDYVHSKGLKFGIYTDMGYNTCQGYEGTYGYEYIDAQTFADWGADYVKNDFCYAFGMNAKDTYKLFGDALKATGRDMVYSICTAGYASAWTWAKEAGGHLWRTSGDIRDNWTSVYSRISGLNNDLYELAGPGGWNDPDMLVVGKLGWGRNLHDTELTADQQYSHISLWCLVASPLMIGCDLAQMDDFTLNLLSNDEVIAVNQDPLGRQGRRIFQENGFEVWVKDLENGSKAVGIFDFGSRELDETDFRSYTLDWEKIGLSGPQKVRDLWRQKDKGIFESSYSVTLPEFGVELIKVVPVLE